MTTKHTHKLKRHRFKTGSEIYFCVLPDCNVKIKPPLALGKRTICWRCGEEFIMTDYTIRLAKPHCVACHSTKDKSNSLPEISIPSFANQVSKLFEDKDGEL